MNENEIMVTNDEVEVLDNPEVVDEEERSMSTGAAVALGSLLTLGGIAAWKFAKKKYNEYKARKEQKLNATEVDKTKNVVDITDEIKLHVSDEDEDE